MKFTPETQQRLVAAIANGAFRYQACAAAGITRKTLRQWERMAERDPDGEHAAFVSELELAQDRAEARLMTMHFALATGAPLPAYVVEMITGPLGKFHQDTLLPALQYRLTFGGNRPFAEARRVEHSGPRNHRLELTIGPTPRDVAGSIREECQRARSGHAGGGVRP